MPTEQLPHCTLISEAGNGLEMVRYGHSMTWVEHGKAKTGGLALVGVVTAGLVSTMFLKSRTNSVRG